MKVDERIDVGRHSQGALAAIGADGRVDIEQRGRQRARVQLVDLRAALGAALESSAGSRRSVTATIRS